MEFRLTTGFPVVEIDLLTAGPVRAPLDSWNAGIKVPEFLLTRARSRLLLACLSLLKNTSIAIAFFEVELFLCGFDSLFYLYQLDWWARVSSGMYLFAPSS